MHEQIGKKTPGLTSAERGADRTVAEQRNRNSHDPISVSCYAVWLRTMGALRVNPYPMLVVEGIGGALRSHPTSAPVAAGRVVVRGQGLPDQGDLTTAPGAWARLRFLRGLRFALFYEQRIGVSIWLPHPVSSCGRWRRVSAGPRASLLSPQTL